jgi:OHCU decarboxylase
MLLSIQALNHLDQTQFVESVGWVFEHSPWVAERAWLRRPFESLTQLSERMDEEVGASSMEEQLALLCAHPDLGTRAKISPGSSSEQAGAGLHQLTPDEFARLSALNSAYRAKFGFPFLYAVKGSGKAAIIEALERRVRASREDEFREALRQAGRIARFRLEGIINQ